MTDRYLSPAPLPFCRGCGHHLVVRNTALALERLGLSPLEVVLVTDIGCHGLVDSFFHTHTVHGLHGRSTALAAGISASLEHGKVIAYLGDGGAVIGLQHLIEAAHRNFNMTVILHNNMLYGMTGGQPSGATPCGYRTPTCPDGTRYRGYNICRRVHTAGAVSAHRVIGKGDFSDAIAHALSVKGFALVEVMEHCVSYGSKHNPGLKMEEIVNRAGLELEHLANPDAAPFRAEIRTGLNSLLDIEPVSRRFDSPLDRRISILLGGSAGEGIQVAAGLFARAAVASGLNVAQKGTYPVTVGIGYSAAEIILAPEPVLHAGYITPNAAVITSTDGLNHFGPALEKMTSGYVLIDESLPAPKTGAEVSTAAIRKTAGPKGAALYGLLLFLSRQGLFPPEALREEVSQSKLSGRIDINRLCDIAAQSHAGKTIP